jgi:hypothetical protein
MRGGWKFGSKLEAGRLPEGGEPSILHEDHLEWILAEYKHS